MDRRWPRPGKKKPGGNARRGEMLNGEKYRYSWWRVILIRTLAGEIGWSKRDGDVERCWWSDRERTRKVTSAERQFANETREYLMRLQSRNVCVQNVPEIQQLRWNSTDFESWAFWCLELSRCQCFFIFFFSSVWLSWKKLSLSKMMDLKNKK